MNILEGNFYFIKDEFFDKVQDKELLQNKENGNKRPCYYCFNDRNNNGIIWFIPVSTRIEKYQKIYDKKLTRNKVVDTIVFGDVSGNKNAFLIQNMFPTIEKYISAQYIKIKRPVTITYTLRLEIERKANKILQLVKKGHVNLVFPNIIGIEKIMLDEIKN